MKRHNPSCPFARYADDAVVHCSSRQQAEQVMGSIELRLAECGLTIHPAKSRIVYCQDSIPAKESHEQAAPGFLLGVSADAVKRMRMVVRGWRISRQTPATLTELEQQYHSVIGGWWDTTEPSIRLRCESPFDTSIASSSSGPDASTRGCRGISGAAWNGSRE